MKLTLSSSIMEREDLLNEIIKNYCEEVLKGTLQEKQQFMLDNKLASVVKEKEANRQ